MRSQPLMSVRFSFFGHSVGAHAADEAARQLRSVDGRTAVHLFVSGRESPASGDAPTVLPRSDRELLAILASASAARLRQSWSGRS